MKNKKETKWHYQVTWKVEEEIQDRAQEKIKQLIEKWCKEQGAQFIDLFFEPDAFKLDTQLENNINVYKATKSLNKGLGKVISGVELYLVVTQPERLEGHSITQEIRVEKVIESLWSAEYYDLDERAADDLEAFKDYLNSRQLATIDVDDQLYIVDIEAIGALINLNCFECTKLYQYGCCCGSPCDMSRKNQRYLDKHLSNLAEEMRRLNEKDYDEVMEKGGFISFDGSIKECNGRCSLLVFHEGVYKCMAHKYALDHEIPIYELCPLSCLMYPLEIIELITDKKKKVLFFTSVVEEDFAKIYGRWGSYGSLQIDHRCVKPEAHNEIFKKEDYRPVYKVNQNLLIHEFGEGIYKGMEQLFNKTT